MRYVSEKKEIEHITCMESETIDKACALIGEYSRGIDEYLVTLVAKLCDVDEKEMFSDSKYLKHVHARWFYWYSYRYMTGEEYKSIAIKFCHIRAFATSCITNSIKKMQSMIKNYKIWQKRWDIIKKIIDASLLASGRNENVTRNATITLNVKTPKGINIELKQDKQL